MKYLRLIILKDLLSEWKKVDCSITLHKTNNKLNLNANTKNNHSIVLPQHRNMEQILEKYPYLRRALTSYTLQISLEKDAITREINYIGELYYFITNRKKESKKNLIKILAAKKLETLFEKMNEEMKTVYKELENTFLEHSNDILEVYESCEELYAYFIDKNEQWNGNQKFIENFEVLFPTISNHLWNNENLYIKRIAETKMFSVQLENNKIVGSTILESLEALENSLKQKQELSLKK